MKRLIVDMDGVLADVYAQFFRYEEKETGRRQRLEDVLGKPEREAFPAEPKFVITPGFFRSAPLMAGCQEVMEQLNNRYDLFIVSAAMEFPQSLPEKQAWLGEHFPYISWKQIVFCGSKSVIRGDIMIDDHFKNLDAFMGETILYTQPHNYFSEEKQHRRANDWKELKSILL